jgi:hypothetical protein
MRPRETQIFQPRGSGAKFKFGAKWGLDLKSATMASGNIADEVISIGNCFGKGFKDL